ncbi:MAG: hypothetical protein HYU37_00180, partial [Acidobacteria bacterium]|nr:hypothetical protein [Acidobacteriota bacterium]
MTTRREFIRGAAASGLAFCKCSLIDAVQAQGSHKHPNLGTRRKPVFVNGRRIGIIDVHAHCLFRDAVALMGADAKNVEPPVKGGPEHYIPLS